MITESSWERQTLPASLLKRPTHVLCTKTLATRTSRVRAGHQVCASETPPVHLRCSAPSPRNLPPLWLPWKPVPMVTMETIGFSSLQCERLGGRGRSPLSDAMGPGDNALGEGQWSHRKGQFSEGVIPRASAVPPSLACMHPLGATPFTCCEAAGAVVRTTHSCWCSLQNCGLHNEGYAPMYICVPQCMVSCDLSCGCRELNLIPCRTYKVS